MKARHGGNVWDLLETGLLTPAEMLDFSADLNPLGPPPGLETLLREGLREVALYPEPTYRLLRQAVADAEGVEPACILPGNGTAELIHLITRRLKLRKAAVVVPAFTEYERALAADGTERLSCLLREEEGFLPDWARLREQAQEAQALFLCNPNNPTGRLWPQESLLECLEWAGRRRMTVVVDEAYMDFVEEGLRYSAVRWLKRFPRLAVLRSMTKSFCVPGLRLGTLAASPGFVSELAEAQPPWPVNGPAALAGRWLAAQGGYVASCRRSILAFGRDFQEQLAGCAGLRVVPSEANFFLCRLDLPDLSGPQAAAALARRGILVRVCDDFTGLEKGRFLRVAVRKPDENERLVRALKEVLSHAG